MTNTTHILKACKTYAEAAHIINTKIVGRVSEWAFNPIRDKEGNIVGWLVEYDEVIPAENEIQ